MSDSKKTPHILNLSHISCCCYRSWHKAGKEILFFRTPTPQKKALMDMPAPAPTLGRGKPRWGWGRGHTRLRVAPCRKWGWAGLWGILGWGAKMHSGTGRMQCIMGLGGRSALWDRGAAMHYGIGRVAMHSGIGRPLVLDVSHKQRVTQQILNLICNEEKYYWYFLIQTQCFIELCRQQGEISTLPALKKTALVQRNLSCTRRFPQPVVFVERQFLWHFCASLHPKGRLGEDAEG